MEKRVKLAVFLVFLGFSVVSFRLFTPSAYSWTPLQGHVTQDTTLMLANSPYRVVDDMTVDGVKLTIEQDLPSLSISLLADPTMLQPYETSFIAIQVTYGGNPIADAVITLTSDKGGEIMDTTSYTDSDGYFMTSFTAPEVSEQTTITLTASAAKTGYMDGQGQTEITVNPNPAGPDKASLDRTLLMYTGGAILVLVALGSGIVYTRRRSRAQESITRTAVFTAFHLFFRHYFECNYENN